MCLKRIALLLLVLFSFCFCSVTAQSAQENLTKLEDYIINISNDALKQNEYVMSLTINLEEYKKLLENSQKELKEQLKMQEMLQKQLSYCERKSRNWKTFAMVAIPLTAITATGITYMVLNNK